MKLKRISPRGEMALIILSPKRPPLSLITGVSPRLPPGGAPVRITTYRSLVHKEQLRAHRLRLCHGLRKRLGKIALELLRILLIRLVDRTLRAQAQMLDVLMEYKPLREWKKRGYLENAPQFIKQEIFLKYGIPNAQWVETGAYMGTTTAFLANHFSDASISS